jgi:signal transduction histidine kinase
LGLAWLAGRALAVFENRAAESRRQAVQSEVAAATLAMSAVLDERTRIARELHDIVAHAVSLIVVQAGAAEPEVEENPAFARQALRAIRTTGTGALAEMRRMVSMLRDADEPDLLSPQPGVDGLPELVAQARDGGLNATLTVDGPAGPLPSGLDLAVYRIVQEALSNVRRHAAASRAEVQLTYHPDRLCLEIRDDGIGAVEGSPSPGGHGLVGMRERAALYGGRLETSGAPGTGFTVSAVLPLAAS